MYFWMTASSMPPSARMSARPDSLHEIGGALHDALHSGLADEHVMRLLGEHEARGARERVEAALGERLELVLAVAVGEHREAEEDPASRGSAR